MSISWEESCSQLCGQKSPPFTSVSPLPSVGRPIPVPQRLDHSKEEVDHYHTLYMEALEQLFEDHKESYVVPASTRLTFI